MWNESDNHGRYTPRLSASDRTRLEVQQHLRLRSALAEWDMTIHIDLERRLHLYCHQPAQIDRLLQNKQTLEETVWQITGCESLALWFAQECIWKSDDEDAETLIRDTLELIQSESVSEEHDGMATATIVKAVTEAAKEVLPSMIGGIVAEEQQAAQAADLKSQIIEVFQSDGFLNFLRQEVRAQLNPPEPHSANGTATVEPTPAVPAAPAPAKSTARKPAAKKSTTKKATPRRTRATKSDA